MFWISNLKKCHLIRSHCGDIKTSVDDTGGRKVRYTVLVRKINIFLKNKAGGKKNYFAENSANKKDQREI